MGVGKGKNEYGSREVGKYWSMGVQKHWSIGAEKQRWNILESTL
jgi:hypothetical protein